MYCRDDGHFSTHVEKDESFRSKSIKKAIFSSFNFDMGNVGKKEAAFFLKPLWPLRHIISERTGKTAE